MRLETLMLANNKISAVDANFAEVCPKIDTIVLTNNRLSQIEDIDMLATCQTLIRLSLLGNLVCNLPNYRLYTIYKIPSLKVLDFQQVTQAEREAARKMFKSDGQNNLTANKATNEAEIDESAAAQQAQAVTM